MHNPVALNNLHSRESESDNPRPTSSLPRSYSTIIRLSANLGAAFASEGLRVLLIDLAHLSTLSTRSLGDEELDEVKRTKRLVFANPNNPLGGLVAGYMTVPEPNSALLGLIAIGSLIAA